MLGDPTGIAYAAAAVVFVWVAVVTWVRRAHSPTVAVSLVVVMGAFAASSIADAVAIASTAPTTAAIATLAILPGVGVATSAFACLGFAIARPQWVPSGGLLAVLSVEPVLATLAVATNSGHQLVYRGEGVPRLTDAAGWEYGPAFWWHTTYSYIALLVGTGFIAWSWLESPAAFRKQRLTLLLAVLVPWVANMVYLARGLGQSVDPTPFAFAVAGVVMLNAMFRQDLIRFSPVARALIVDQIGDAIVVVNAAGRVLDLNAAAVALVHGMSPDASDELVGASADALFGEHLGAPGSPETELVVELSGGRAEFEVRASQLIDPAGRDLGTVFVARDVTDANNQTRRLTAAHAQLVRQVETIDALRADLEELASRDALTGLHNRRHLVLRFASMLAAAERLGHPIAVVLFDIDGFKAVNDAFGHLAGDAVLIGLARLLEVHAPSGSLVTRWGGEEFFIALPGADADAGYAFADTLRGRCEHNEILVDGQPIRCTLSGGVAAYPASGTTMDALFDAVDASMYNAKKAGRNVVFVHGPLRSATVPGV